MQKFWSVNSTLDQKGHVHACAEGCVSKFFYVKMFLRKFCSLGQSIMRNHQGVPELLKKKPPGERVYIHLSFQALSEYNRNNKFNTILCGVFCIPVLFRGGEAVQKCSPPPCLTPNRELLMSRNFAKILSVISTSQKHQDCFADGSIFFIRKRMEK